MLSLITNWVGEGLAGHQEMARGRASLLLAVLCLQAQLLGFGGAVELRKHLLLRGQAQSPGKDKDISPCSVSLLGFGVTEEPQTLCSRAVTPQGEVFSSLRLSGPKAIKNDVSDVTQMAVAPHWDQWYCAGTQGFVLNPNRKP